MAEAAKKVVMTGKCDECGEDLATLAFEPTIIACVYDVCPGQAMCKPKVQEESASELPHEMHLLFENGLFLGAFVDREKAISTAVSRMNTRDCTIDFATYEMKLVDQVR